MTSPGLSDQSEGGLGQYLREIARYPLIDRDEEARLARRIRSGEEEALNKLVKSNLRFVVSVSRKYQNQGVPLSDLINEGNLGLIKAARRFDETKGTKFISYAVWWIRQAILQALAQQGRIVRVPLSRAGLLHRISRQKALLAQQLNREPTATEIAGALGSDSEAVEETLAFARSHLSLDAPMGPGEDGCLMDCLPDQLSPGPDEAAFGKALTDTLNAALDTLEAREAVVLRLYFGIGDSAPMSLEEIRQRSGDHARARAPDQGKGAGAAEARVEGALPGELRGVVRAALRSQRVHAVALRIGIASRTR